MRMLKPKEVEEQLQVHRSTVYRLISSRRLRSVRIGGVYRIPQEALDELVQRGEVQDAEVLTAEG